MSSSYSSALSILTACIMLPLANGLHAQSTFHIAPATSVRFDNNISIMLDNTQLVNQGSLDGSGGTLKFTGNTPVNISGNPFTVYRLEVNTENNAVLTLRQNLHVLSEVKLISGNIDIGNQVLHFATGALLNGQSETARLLSTGSGYAEINTILNAPVGANPGNFGAVISSNEDLGATTVRMGFAEQDRNHGAPSILRNYTISPTNNHHLGATLKFQYVDAELNGNNESSLTLWENRNNSWKDIGKDDGSTTLNYIVKRDIQSFSKYTLFESKGPDFSIFPNPVFNHLQLKFEWPDNGPVIIRIYDNNSVLVKTVNHTPLKKTNTISINVSDLYKGVYTIEVLSAKNTAVSKFIKL